MARLRSKVKQPKEQFKRSVTPKQIIGGANQTGDTITVDAENGNLVLR